MCGEGRCSRGFHSLKKCFSLTDPFLTELVLCSRHIGILGGEIGMLSALKELIFWHEYGDSMSFYSLLIFCGEDLFLDDFKRLAEIIFIINAPSGEDIEMWNGITCSINVSFQ